MGGETGFNRRRVIDADGNARSEAGKRMIKLVSVTKFVESMAGLRGSYLMPAHVQVSLVR
jgi:hypothetical protein